MLVKIRFTTIKTELNILCYRLCIRVAPWAAVPLKPFPRKLGSPYRSSYRTGSAKKGVLKNFANYTGKQLCWSLFLIKLQALGLFSGEICRIFKNTYFEEHLQTTASVTIKSQKLSVVNIKSCVKFSSRKEFLTLVIKNYARANIKIFWPCPILLNILLRVAVYCLVQCMFSGKFL